MKERWWLSNFSPMDLTGGTELSAEKYCRILNLKYMSASKLGIRRLPGTAFGWDIAKEIDDVLSDVSLEFIMYNSVNCWSRKPNADKSICICNENFNREAKSVSDSRFVKLKLDEWSYQKKAVANADKVITVSRQEHDYLLEDVGIESDILESSTRLDLFFPMDKKRARTELGLPIDKKIFLFVGRRHIRKGYDIILELAKLHPEYIFVNIVGDLPGAKPKNIEETGNVADEDMNLFYNSADYLLAPSRYESFGLMFTEALATNTPIIGSRVGIAHDIPEAYGIFLDEITTEAFNKALDSSNRSFEPGRALAEKRFSYEVMAENLRRIAQ